VIMEKDLQEAIAECQGQKDPNANTCVKLAAFLIIKDYMYPDEPSDLEGVYKISKTPKAPVNYGVVQYESDTEFSRLINGKSPDIVWPVIDELMSTLQVINSRLYESVIHKIES